MQVRQVARKPQECFANGWLCDWVHFTLQCGTMWSCLQTILASYFLKSPVQRAECICGSISSTSVCITVSLDFLLGWWPLFWLTGLDLHVPGIVYCDSSTMVMVEKQIEQSAGRICSEKPWKERGNCIPAAGVGEQHVSQVGRCKQIFRSLMTETLQPERKCVQNKNKAECLMLLKLCFTCGGITHPT